MHIVQCIVSLISTLLDLLRGFIYLLNLNLCSVSISVFLLLMVFAPERTKWGTKSLDKVSSTHQLSVHVKALYLKTVCVYSIFHTHVNRLVCIFVLVTSGNYYLRWDSGWFPESKHSPYCLKKNTLAQFSTIKQTLSHPFSLRQRGGKTEAKQNRFDELGPRLSASHQDVGMSHILKHFFRTESFLTLFGSKSRISYIR